MSPEHPTPTFFQRDFSAMDQPADLAWSCDRLSWSAIGGPVEAVWKVEGPEMSLWQLARWLRAPVAAWVDNGLVWWGYHHAALIHTRGQDFLYSLDELATRLRVSYTYAGVGTSASGAQGLTDWLTDDQASARYGIKELEVSLSDISPAAALSLRGKELAMRKSPGCGPTFAAGQKFSAQVTARGWWPTLDWRYAEVAPVEAVAYTARAATEQAVGSASANAVVAQQVVFAATLHPVQLTVWARRAGNPTDNLVIALYARDGGGHPTGDARAQVSIPGKSLATTRAQVTATFNEALVPAGNYAIKVSRSGASSSANYFAVEVNQACGYAGGVLFLGNGSGSWASRSPNADLLFSIGVNDQVDTGSQVADLIAAFGQFASGCSSPASGMVQGTRLDGSKLAREAIENLMASGVDGGGRMLATVGPERFFRVFEEPARPAQPTVQIGAEGITVAGAPARLAHAGAICGNWARVEGQPPGMDEIGVDTDQFIDGLEWTPGAGFRPTYRGRPTPADIVRVRK